MSTNKSVKCKLCGKKYVSKQALIDHIDKYHSDNIPEGWNAARYENYLRTGKTEGHCVYCKKETGWNDTTGKYNRMCGSEACKKKARELANKNYIGLHGKPYSINDPEQQKKMVYGRKNSGKYTFVDEDTGKKYVAMYDSSYGKDFLEMIDTFLNWDGSDIIAPSPHTYYYEYEGKKHFYIPDVYSTSLNLEIELKDGGDNPNTHPKIQAVDKVKEKKKDEVMASLKDQVNYIKICNKDYTEFFALLSRLKDKDVCQLPKWDSKLESIAESSIQIETHESSVEEGVSDDKLNLIKRNKLLKDPMLNYDKLMKYYRKRLFYDNLSKRDWQYTYNELLNVRDYLQSVVNQTHGESDKRMEYEANKALKQVNEFIAYMEDHDPKKLPVTESTNSNNIPIYIIAYRYRSPFASMVRLKTHSDYNHIALALSTDFEHAYTFSRRTDIDNHKMGFTEEPLSYMVSTDKSTMIKVLKVYVPKKSYNKLQSIIDDYNAHKDDTKFNWFGMFDIVNKRAIDNDDLDSMSMVCSSFVDYTLKEAGIDITKKPNSNLVTPADLSNADKNNKNVTVVYQGLGREFDSKVIQESTLRSSSNQSDPNSYTKFSVENDDETIGSVMNIDIDKDIYEINGFKDSYTLTKRELESSDIEKYQDMPELMGHLDTDDNCVGFFDGNKLVGYVATNMGPDGIIWVTALEVIPEYRGYGLATQILDYGVTMLHGQAVSVNCKNKEALRIYTEFGFKIWKESLKQVESGEKDNYLMYLEDNGSPVVIKESTFIEAIKEEERYYPVFILLSYTGTNMAKLIKAFTHDPYAHSSISFDTELTNMISFNRDGMVVENIQKDIWKEKSAQIKYSLYMYLATADEYDAMRNFVNELLGRQSKLKYNILGLTNFIFGRGSEREDKFFCSEFVASVINAGDKKVVKTKPYMTSPYMLAKNKNFKFIKKGLIKNYNSKVVDNIIRDYLEGGGYTDVTIK